MATRDLVPRADGEGSLGDSAKRWGAVETDIMRALSMELPAPTELTIATGAITVTQMYHTVDTESDAASDDLDTINGGATRRIIILKPANGARTVVVKHNTGNIWLKGGADLTLDDVDDSILLYWNGSKWTDIGAGGGGGGSMSDLIDDTTPQLGGNLDVNGKSIVSVSNGNIIILPNGTGSVIIDGISHPQADGTDGQTLVTDGAGQLSFVTRREVLTAARTYYTRTDGSDSNDGLTDSAGGAFLTPQKAIDTAAGLDSSIYNVTLDFGTGTYTGTFTLKSMVGAGKIIIQGDNATPSNVVFHSTSGHCLSGSDLITVYHIIDLKVTGTGGSGGSIASTNGSFVKFGNIDFGGGAQSHLIAGNRGLLQCLSDYAITGAATYHMNSSSGTILIQNKTVTITGTLAFSTFSIINAMGIYFLNAGTSFDISGATVTGRRYSVSGGSYILTTGGGSTFFPGDVAGVGGTTTGGGVYA